MNIHLDPNDIAALWVTLKLASLSTFFLFIIGCPIAWWLAHSQSRLRLSVEAVISLPIVLPPTVLGFYLLIGLGRDSPIGSFLETSFGHSLVFSFPGLVVGSVIYSLPFVVQPIQNSFLAIGKRPVEVAASLGISPMRTFWTVIVPLAKPGFISAAVLGFAHTLGEFGVVLMIGGNIPGETKVLSIAIYEHVESLEYNKAHILSGGLLAASFIMLYIVFASNRNLAESKK